MKTRPRFLWLLIAGLGLAGAPLAARAASPPPALAPVAAPAAAPAAPEEAETAQRRIAAQHLPGLIVFLAGTLALSGLLWSKSRDMATLRKQGYFQADTEPKEPS